MNDTFLFELKILKKKINRGSIEAGPNKIKWMYLKIGVGMTIVLVSLL